MLMSKCKPQLLSEHPCCWQTEVIIFSSVNTRFIDINLVKTIVMFKTVCLSRSIETLDLVGLEIYIFLYQCSSCEIILLNIFHICNIINTLLLTESGPVHHQCFYSQIQRIQSVPCLEQDAVYRLTWIPWGGVVTGCG